MVRRSEPTNSVQRTQYTKKIASKIPENQRQKKNLDGLFEVLAPGRTVCKISPTTSVNKESNRQEVRVQKSDIA